MSSTETVIDPIMAVATLIAVVAGDGITLGHKEQNIITTLLAEKVHVGKAREAAIYSLLVVETMQDRYHVISNLSMQLTETLTLQEKEQLLKMVDEARTTFLMNIPDFVDPTGYECSLEELKQKLGFIL